MDVLRGTFLDLQIYFVFFSGLFSPISNTEIHNLTECSLRVGFVPVYQFFNMEGVSAII